MTHAILVRASLVLGLALAHPIVATDDAHARATRADVAQESAPAPKHAKGEFDVALTARSTEDEKSEPSIGRMLVDKQFHGDLDGTSKGQMLSFMSETKGS